MPSTQHYHCVVIQPVNEGGLLPPGIHLAEWEELWTMFGTTPHRRRLLLGFRRAMASLKIAGCRIVYLDGSFVTSKEAPGDFDACWDHAGVEFTRLDPILLTFDSGRAAQKVKFGGELFPAHAIADSSSASPFLEFFQIHKETEVAKGIIAIDLERFQP